MHKRVLDIFVANKTHHWWNHRYGEPAGKVTEETLATAGHVVATAWTVSKLRKALNPKEGIKPTTKTAFVKSIAKNVITGGKK